MVKWECGCCGHTTKLMLAYLHLCISLLLRNSKEKLVENKIIHKGRRLVYNSIYHLNYTIEGIKKRGNQSLTGRLVNMQSKYLEKKDKYAKTFPFSQSLLNFSTQINLVLASMRMYSR